MMSIVNRCFNLTEKGNINIQLHLSCVLQKKYNVWNNMILSKWWQGCNFKVDNQLYFYSIKFFALFGSEQTQSPEGLDAGGVYRDWSGGLLVCLHPEPEF